MSFSVRDGEDRSLGDSMIQKWGHLPYNTLQAATAQANEIFDSSQWKANPGQFMKSRMEETGGTKEKEKETDLNTVVHSVLMRSILNRFDASEAKYKRSEFLKTLNLSFRNENLVPFLMSQYDHLDNKELKLICDYTTKIFTSLKFQQEPGLYMKKWGKERGYTQEFRLPEDPSMEIVQYVVKKYKLWS
jgi:hypothetical protein